MIQSGDATMRAGATLRPQSWLVWLSIVPCCWIAAGAPVVAEESLSQDVLPLLETHCAACHGEDAPEAGFGLAALAALDPYRRAAAWFQVQKRIARGEMPPEGEPQPNDDERRTLLASARDAIAGYTLGGRPDPGPLTARRLNVREQRNHFRDLAIDGEKTHPRRASYEAKQDGSVNLYHSVIPPPEHPCDFVTRVLPPDTHDGGFDTIGENLSIPPFLLERYFRAGELLLDDCLSLKGKDEHGRYQWRLRELMEKAADGPLPRGVESRREVVAGLLQDFASRAFRRPLSRDEVERYVGLFDASQQRGEAVVESIRLALQAILVSPRFVVLWADDSAALVPADELAATAVPIEPSSPFVATVRPLDDFELASRLAIFLWSSVPDRELWQLAAQGRLQDQSVLEQQTRRMLNDRRVIDGFQAGFFHQWLQLDLLDRSAPDAELYPQYFQENLAELMKQELLLFVDAIVVEDRSILELLDADWGFLCHPLAEHYGIADFPGKKPSSNAQAPWYRVRFADQRRGGIITMGKVLTGTSQPARTSPVHRGKWLLETVLGAPPPPPPPEVDNVLKAPNEDSRRKLTVPQLLAKHRENAACNACHRRIDPLGMALENFDPTGKWRETDEQQPIDARGELVDGAKFNGAGELKALLISRKDQFARAFVEQMLAYSLGRKLEFYDEPTVERVVQAVAQDDYKISRVVVEVAKSYPFGNRRAQQRGTVNETARPTSPK